MVISLFNPCGKEIYLKKKKERRKNSVFNETYKSILNYFSDIIIHIDIYSFEYSTLTDKDTDVQANV